MFEYQYGIRLSDGQLSQFRRKLIQIFAQEYDIKSIKCPILSSRSYYRFIYRLALHEPRQEMAGRVMIP